MKTYEEMAQSALDRIAAHKTEQRKRRKTALKIAAPAALCCVAVILGVRFGRPGALPEPPIVTEPAAPITPAAPTAPILPQEASSPASAEPTVTPTEPFVPAKPTVTPTEPTAPAESAIIPTVPVDGPPVPIPLPTLPDDAPSVPITLPTVPDDGPSVPIPLPSVPDVVTSEPEPPATEPSVEDTPKPGFSGGLARLWWKNELVMSGTLYAALNEDPGREYAVSAIYSPVTSEITDFVYEGKTLAEWAVASVEEAQRYEKMYQLLKNGDELKYGTALYETGTPDGIKWDRRFYEDQAAYYGELLERYIVNGEFLRAELETDLAAFDGKTVAEEQYRLAWNAYLDTVLPAVQQKLTEAQIRCERAENPSNGLTIHVTAEQLETLPLDDPTYWYFKLAQDEPAQPTVTPAAIVG